MLRPDPRWALKMSVNSVGACITAVVTLIFAVTKFHDGAWVVLIIIPITSSQNWRGYNCRKR